MNRYYIISKKVVLIFLIASVSFNITGCSLLESPSALLTMPSTYVEGENSLEINELLNKFNYILTSPISGLETRSIIKSDLDNDKSSEIILLYKKANEVNNYGLLLLSKSDEKLIILDDKKFNCSNIYSLNLRYVTNDGFTQLIISTKNVKDTNKTLHIYSLDDSMLKEHFTTQYTDMIIKENVFPDSPYYIFTIKNNLHAYVHNNNKFVIVDSLHFADNINHIALTLGNYTVDKSGIFCTFKYNDDSVFTEIYDITNEKFNRIFDYGKEQNKYTSHIPNKPSFSNLYKGYYDINSFTGDINKDGIYEFRTINALDKSSSSLEDSNFNYWFNYIPKDNISYNLQLTLITYVDISNKLLVKIPGNLISNEYLSCSTLDNTDYTSLSFTKDIGNVSKWLFSINIYKNTQPPNVHSQNDNIQTVILQNLNDTYIVDFDKTSFNDANITDKYIMSDFLDFDTIHMLER